VDLVSADGVRHLVDGLDLPAALTGRVLVTISEAQDRIVGVDLEAGKVLWERKRPGIEGLYLANEETLVFSELDEKASYDLGTLDLSSGTEVILSRVPYGTWYLWPELSSGTSVALGPTRSPEASLAADPTAFSILDLTTGTISDAASAFTATR
jgi:hypothetical protein